MTETPPSESAAPPVPIVVRPRRTTGYKVAIWLLSVLLAAALGGGAWLATYLIGVNDQWQAHSQQWQSLAEQHGADLAQARSDLEATSSELDAVRTQLATAQDRITQLADEKAQLGDESAITQQLADYQQRVSTAAGQVATALATCIDGQEALIRYLENSDLYDPASLATYRADVERYCGDARDANAELQAELSR